MKFTVLPIGTAVPTNLKNHLYLMTDGWDDWFEFNTLYSLVAVNGTGNIINIGSVKIGQFDMEEKQSRANLPQTFNSLNDQFFSIGQDDSYYENLNELRDFNGADILNALKDIALDSELYDRAIEERVTKISLLRSVSHTVIKGQYRRLANGGARLSEYSFKYKSPKPKNGYDEIVLDFDVEPESNPSTNIHVLIGRNGVGKTHLINNMISSLIDETAKKSKVGQFISEKDESEELFANVVSVTFSAFDESEPLAEKKDKSSGIQYSYVGLKRVKKSGETNLAPKSPVILKNEFIKSILSCRAGSKISRWKNAISVLESDPVFLNLNITGILDIEDEGEFKKTAGDLFKNLSSGHKIVLLTITRLVETVEERSLVFLDEPEAHLHPPLLSAFIRSLSNLLINRNGVAIIATHSPVVLQEVPKSCAWKLWRSGHNTKVERLETESFGENIGVLTREVFGLELTHSGFHKILTEAVEEHSSYIRALRSFDDQLGMEAKGILKALYLTKGNAQ
jgi:energy-coupling factor transporter ATP-binding protein EcfA2